MAQTRIQRKTRAPFFIDKMPNNFAHVGLIHLILPNAKIIDARRHPLGCWLLVLQAALRARPELHLRPRRARPVLRRLRRADGAFRCGAARPRASRVLRTHGRGHRGRGAAPARVLRTAVRGGGAAFSRKPARGAHRKLRTGASADFSRRFGAMASLRAHGSDPSSRRLGRSSIDIPTRRSFDSVASGIHSG